MNVGSFSGAQSKRSEALCVDRKQQVDLLIAPQTQVAPQTQASWFVLHQSIRPD
jgi:hypothetical protein